MKRFFQDLYKVVKSIQQARAAAVLNGKYWY